MEPDQQEALDQQVQQVMQELQAAGEPASVESVARNVRRRTGDVLEAIRRVTGTSPATPDVDTRPEQYPEVQAAEGRVVTIAAARQDAERTLQTRETALAQAEAAVAEALIDGREAPPLVEVRQAVLQAAETVHLLELAQSTAKTRHAAALAAAEAAHRQVIWHQFQALLTVHLTAARRTVETWEPLRSFCAQHGWAFGT